MCSNDVNAKVESACSCGHDHSHEGKAKDLRPDWDTYFMQIAHVVKLRANCSRRMVAAVIVKDKRIIATGYNGTPRGVTNCFEGGCARCSGSAPSGSGLDECICSHAEENAITQSAYHGISTKDSTIYVTLNPCLTCAKMIINAGIREVVYDEEYRFSAHTKALLAEAGVICRKFVAKTQE
jgi:dCMP deaminase